MKQGLAKNQKVNLLFLTFASVFGLIFSLCSVCFLQLPTDEFAFRSLTVGSVFALICTLGIFAAVRPSSCSMQPRFGKNKNGNRNDIKQKIFVRSHHPECEGFKNHILELNKIKLCASCYGLFSGAVIALLGTGWYFFANFGLGQPIVLFSLGALGVFFGLVQSALPRLCSGIVRFTGGLLFVVGSFLMISGIDGLLKNTGFDLFFIALCVLLIYTRIEWSTWDHQRICLRCRIESCK